MKILVTVICLMASTFVFAQNRDSLLVQMARETCMEIKSKDFSKVSEEDLEMELGMAMMPLFAKYSNEIRDVFNVDLGNQADVTTFGQEIGIRLVSECPEFIQIFAGKKNGGATKITASESKVTGKLQKIVDGEFTHILVKDQRGKIEKLWWFDYFEGAELLLDKKNIDGNFTVTFTEKEVYSSTLRDYVKIRVITGIRK